jgi:2OG-Fe(II) oxygenase superfamily
MDGALEAPEGTLWKLHDHDGGNARDVSLLRIIPFLDVENLYLLPQVLKYLLYEPMNRFEAEKAHSVYLPEHTDFNTVTTLFSQPVAGLQVKGFDGSWKWVKVNGLQDASP